MTFPLRFLRPHCGQRCCSMSCRCLRLVRSFLSRKHFSHIVLSFTARFTQQRAQKPALMRSVRVCRTTTMQFLHIRPPFSAGRVPHRVHQPRLASAFRRALPEELTLFRQAEHRVLSVATLFRPQYVQTPALRRLWLARLVLFCRITRHRAQAVRFLTRGLSRHTRHKPLATAFFTFTLSLAMQLRQRLLSAAGISRQTLQRPASIVRARDSRANRALSARHGAQRTRPATGARLRQLTHLLEPSACAVLFLTRATMGVGMTSFFLQRCKRLFQGASTFPRTSVGIASARRECEPTSTKIRDIGGTRKAGGTVPIRNDMQSPLQSGHAPVRQTRSRIPRARCPSLRCTWWYETRAIAPADGLRLDSLRSV